MRSNIRRFLLSLSRIVLGLAIALLLLQCKLIYHPRGYSEEETKLCALERVSYATTQGRQVCWIDQGSTEGLIWLVFAGNGTRALDLAGYFRHVAKMDRDTLVHVDYPAYGECEGRPTPASIRESVKALLPALASHWQTTPEALRPRLRVFGHSLGCAAALMAMEEHGVKRGTLVAPFYSMMDMARHTVGWPLCCLLHHRFDNAAALHHLQSTGNCQLEVLHGSADEVIPQSQSAKLAQEFPAIISYRVIRQGRHNTIFSTDRDSIVAAMLRMR